MSLKEIAPGPGVLDLDLTGGEDCIILWINVRIVQSTQTIFHGIRHTFSLIT